MLKNYFDDCVTYAAMCNPYEKNGQVFSISRVGYTVNTIARKDLFSDILNTRLEKSTLDTHCIIDLTFETSHTSK